MKTFFVFLVAVSFFGLAFAQSNPGQDSRHSEVIRVAQAATSLSDGEVRKVDKEAQKVTIKHGPLEGLGMPPMTMVFRVVDPSMLDNLKTGDKIKFIADKINGAYTVTQIGADMK